MDLLPLGLVIVGLLLMMGYQTWSLTRSHRQQTSLLLSLLSSRETLIQSLQNQLRTTDPYSLLGLNAATIPSSTLPEDPNAYVSHSDSAEFSRLPVGVGDELTQEDLAAFGDTFVMENN